MIKKLWRFSSAVLMVILLLSFGGAQAEAALDIKIGYFDYDNYITIGEEERITGYAGEILDMLAVGNPHWNFVPVKFTRGTFLENMRKGFAIVSVQSPYHSKYRARFFTYSEKPVGVEYGIFYTGLDQSVYYEDFAKFDGMRVGTIVGDMQNDLFDEYQEEHGFTVEYVVYNTLEEIKEALALGEIDGLIYGSTVEQADLKIIARYAETPLHIAVNEWGKIFIDHINRVLNKAYEENPDFLDNLYVKYFGEAPKALQAMTEAEEKAALEAKAQEEENRSKAEEETGAKAEQETAAGSQNQDNNGKQGQTILLIAVVLLSALIVGGFVIQGAKKKKPQKQDGKEKKKEAAAARKQAEKAAKAEAAELARMQAEEEAAAAEAAELARMQAEEEAAAAEAAELARMQAEEEAAAEAAELARMQAEEEAAAAEAAELARMQAEEEAAAAEAAELARMQAEEEAAAAEAAELARMQAEEEAAAAEAAELARMQAEEEAAAAEAAELARMQAEEEAAAAEAAELAYRQAEEEAAAEAAELARMQAEEEAATEAAELARMQAEEEAAAEAAELARMQAEEEEAAKLSETDENNYAQADTQAKAEGVGPLMSWIDTLADTGKDHTGSAEVQEYTDEQIRSEIYLSGLTLSLQPRYGLNQNTVVGAEVSISYRHPIRDRIYPEELVASLTQKNKLYMLDRYIFESLCLCKPQERVEAGKTFEIVVPVFTESVVCADFSSWYIAAVKSYNIPPEIFRLDLVYRWQTSQDQQVYQALRELAAAGFRVALKDVGDSNYPLELFSEVELEAIVVAEKLVVDALDNEKKRKLLFGLKGLCDQMNFRLEADRIDSREKLELLTELGCHVLQGNFLTRPIPLDQFWDYKRKMDNRRS